MSSALSSIPVEKRRQLAATLGLFAVLFVAMGLVATTGRTPTVVKVFSAIALIMAALLGLAAWGVVHSVHLDLSAARLDKQLGDIAAGQGCGCGCDHDADEMQVTPPAPNICGHDGSGTDCGHDCQSCVLASMRPSPTQPRAERLT